MIRIDAVEEVWWPPHHSQRSNVLGGIVAIRSGADQHQFALS